jgi:hypothetical protein
VITTLGVVSATENMDNQEISLDSNSTDLDLAIEDNLAESGGEVKSFDEIQDQINHADVNGIVELEGTYQGNKKPIAVNKSVTLQGKGSGATLDAKNLSSILKITANNVILKNITFINGYSASNAGAIDWHANNGQMFNCSFFNNSAFQNGGAINWNGMNLNITGCEFNDCTCYSKTYEYEPHGGALYIQGSNIYIGECSFKAANSAAFRCFGGAIYLRAYNSTIVDSNFTDFNVTLGELYISRSTSAKLRNLKFANYVSWLEDYYIEGWKGPVRCEFSSDILMADCDIVNTTTDSNIKYAGEGGGFYGYKSELINITNCNFINNTAQDGSSIYLYNTSSVVIDNCIFSKNEGYTGVINIEYCSNTIFMDNNFSKNTLYDNVGIYAMESPYTIIINNTFNDMDDDYIKAIEIYSCPNSKVINCTFSRDEWACNIEEDVEVIKKYPAEIVFEDITCSYGCQDKFVVKLIDSNTREPLKGKELQFYVNGAENYRPATNENGEWEFPVYEFDVGVYNISVELYDSANYNASKKTIKLNVTPVQTSIIMNNHTVYVQQLFTPQAYVNASGLKINQEFVKFYIDDAYIGDGKLSYNSCNGPSIRFNSTGNYTLKAVYEGNKNFAPAYGFANITVIKEKISLWGYGSVGGQHRGEKWNFTISLSPRNTINEVLKYYVNGVEEGSFNVTASKGGFSYIPQKPGEYNVKIVFEGSYRYEPFNFSCRFFTNKLSVNVTTWDVSFNSDDDKFIKVAIVESKSGVPAQNETILVTINSNSSFTFTGISNSEGIAFVNVSSIAPGDYKFSVQNFNSTYYSVDWSGGHRLIVKTPTNISVNTLQEVAQGQTSRINIKVTPQSGELNDGTIRCYVDGRQVTLQNFQGYEVSFDYTFENLGKHNITATFNDSVLFEDSNKTVQVTVKIPTALVVTDEAFNKKDEKIITYNLTDRDGNILSKDVKFIIRNSEGGEVDVADLECGVYTFNAVFEGDDDYMPSQSETKRLIVKTPTQLTVNTLNEITYSDKSSFNIAVTPESGNVSDGVVKLYINGTEVKSIKVENNEVSFEYVIQKTGRFNVTAIFGQSDYFEDSSSSVHVTVNRMPTTLTAEDAAFNKGDEKIIRYNLTDMNNVTVSGNVKVNVNDSQGQPVSIDSLDSGIYSFNVVFEGDDNYVGSQSEIKTLIVKVATQIHFAGISNPLTLHPIVLNSTLSDDKGNVFDGDLHYFINNEEVTGNFTPSSTGQHTLKIVYDGDRYHSACESVISFNVGDGRINTVFVVNDVTAVYGDAKYIKAILKTSDGVLKNTDVELTLNGVTKTLTTDKKGEVALLVSLAPKAYDAKIEFRGNTNFKPVSQDFKVTVKKAALKLTAKNKKFKAKKKTKKYSVTLKDSKGKAIVKAKLTLKIKNKTYRATTNAKGKATFKIKKLAKKGNYKSVVKFAGDAYYNAVSKTVKINVKK